MAKSFGLVEEGLKEFGGEDGEDETRMLRRGSEDHGLYKGGADYYWAEQHERIARARDSEREHRQRAEDEHLGTNAAKLFWMKLAIAADGR